MGNYQGWIVPTGIAQQWQYVFGESSFAKLLWRHDADLGNLGPCLPGVWGRKTEGMAEGGCQEGSENIRDCQEMPGLEKGSKSTSWGKQVLTWGKTLAPQINMNCNSLYCGTLSNVNAL